MNSIPIIWSRPVQRTLHGSVKGKLLWIRKHFFIDATEMPDDLTAALQERLLELPSDNILDPINHHFGCSTISLRAEV